MAIDSNMFGDQYQSLKTASGKTASKQHRNSFMSLRDAPIEYASRERLIPRQTYAQQQNVEGENKRIVMKDPTTGIDSLLIGFEEESRTSDG